MRLHFLRTEEMYQSHTLNKWYRHDLKPKTLLIVFVVDKLC